jgi:hypothetical protein
MTKNKGWQSKTDNWPTYCLDILLERCSIRKRECLFACEARAEGIKDTKKNVDMCLMYACTRSRIRYFKGPELIKACNLENCGRRESRKQKSNSSKAQEKHLSIKKCGMCMTL